MRTKTGKRKEKKEKYKGQIKKQNKTKQKGKVN